MRRIENQCLQHMASPIRFVMYHIHEALVNIAPERRSDFEKYFADFTLEYLDVNDFVCDVDVPAKHIRLSRQVAELMWSVSFGYVTFYTKVVQAHKPVTKQVFDLAGDPEVSQAMKLLKWAYENWLNPKKYVPWPADLPQPVEQPIFGTMQNVADELSLCSIAAYMHHELAHIRLQHDGADSIEQEKEADSAMVDWILDHDLLMTDPRFIKRALGIAFAMEVLTAHGIYTDNFGGVTHPCSYDRLVNTVSRYVTDPNHVVWAILVSTLKLHLDNRKINTPDIVYSDFKECVNAYADLMSR